ncbi:membrane protein YdbS with pleckstrin-like domain [Microbacteriaceae bacterium SG_E_30_P1]|uniref:Membrane protein YdbS with pleckstrin-like domain n=1 Tax=Antiquaquibacter oligotrophicus TaxID=2880260 RepID=A0ABT6KN54_9MICO|nr:hypothetical protein [Antiquaquibacter oligotrophicus]MDH6181445.1 membrane protein YdbS with pleckstrin-like domain [Antiquaquibacter oligotrophicus]UDF12864.1 hypothetical protein LH407_11975 [Antiquaquibacter oligotrophicus]
MDHPTTVRPVDRRRITTIIVVLCAVVIPIVSIAALTPAVVSRGEVSHWPWDQYGFWGWWLVPAGLWLSVIPAVLRYRPARWNRLATVLLIAAVVTTLALFYNP